VTSRSVLSSSRKEISGHSLRTGAAVQIFTVGLILAFCISVYFLHAMVPGWCPRCVLRIGGSPVSSKPLYVGDFLVVLYTEISQQAASFSFRKTIILARHLQLT
jgi:hypothetical protein